METFVSFVVGLVIGAYIMGFLLGDEMRIGINAVPMIANCEKELPRNEHCTIIAVPKSSLEDD